MARDPFDTLARSFPAPGSRRRALAAAFASALGLLGLTHPGESVAGGRCKPSCGECASCTKGKCHKTEHGKSCKHGTCHAKADDTPCSRGFCRRGSCAAL